MTQCKTKQVNKQGQMSLDLGLGKGVIAAFDGGLVSSDGGLLLLRKADERLELTKLAAFCVRDQRRPDLVKHGLSELLQQRIFAIAAGYEDCNDAGYLRNDAMHKLAIGKLSGDDGLASQPTLSRFENSADEVELKALQKLLIHSYVRRQKRRPDVIRLTMDTSCDEVHGYQQMSFWNGFYGTYCYVPLFIFDHDGFPLAALLRHGNAAPGEGALRMLREVVHNLRLAWPNVRIELAADAAFSLREIYEYCEEENVTYYICIKPNAVLEYHTKELVVQCKEIFDQLGSPTAELRYGCMKKADVYRAWRQKEERVRFSSKKGGRMQEHFEDERVRVRKFKEFRYCSRSWKEVERRIVARVEYTAAGPEVRYVVTNAKSGSARAVYGKYCLRARCENWIKDLKNYLACDRTSCQEFNANQFRLLLHTFAYMLLWEIKQRAGLQHSTIETLRLKLLKIGVVVTESVRRVKLSFASEHPWQIPFRLAWQRL